MLLQLDNEVGHEGEIQHQHDDARRSHAADMSSVVMAWIVVHVANSPARPRVISNV